MRLIDAEALKHKFAQITYTRYTADMGQGGFEMFSEKEIEEIIDNATELGYEDGILSIENATRRAIELEDAYNNGWSDGFSDGENERPQGEWEKIGEIGLAYKCDKCGEVSVIPTNFCPNCGVKMKGGAEE